MAIRPGDKRLYQQLKQFHDVGKRKGFFVGAQRQAYFARLEEWLPAFKKVMNPASLSAAQRKQLQPLLKVFDETHRRVHGLALLLQGHALLAGKEEALASAIPSVTVGDDEEEDLDRLQHWPAIFSELFDGAFLPDSLKGRALTDQIGAHQKAEKKLPESTAGQIYRGAYATLKKLRAEAENDLWTRMHSMLDGDFGEDAETKGQYGWDRRLRGGGPNRHRRGTDPGSDDEKEGAGGDEGGEESDAGGETEGGDAPPPPPGDTTPK